MKIKALFGALLLISGVLLSSFALVAAEPQGQQVDASMSLTYISYAGITAKCLAAGLSSNPYPVPTTPETFTVPGNPDISQIREQSQYWVVTLTIDGQQYSGIACFVYSGMSDKDTGLTVHHFDGTYYLGAIGDLDSGFKGTLQMKLYGRVGTTIDHGTVHCLLQGFGDINEQTLNLSSEFTLYANAFKDITGYCNKA
jgi:hypothetical protein